MCLFVCMYASLSFDFLYKQFIRIAEVPRKCSVECERFWMNGSRESCHNQPVLNRPREVQCLGDVVSISGSRKSSKKQYGRPKNRPVPKALF